MQSGRPSPPGTVDDIVDILLQVGRTMRQRMQADGFEPGTFLLLQQVAGSESLRVSDLADCAGLDPSTVSRHVAQLERAGLLTRTPDPDDRRAQRLRLSPQGRRQLRQALERRRTYVADTLRAWTADDLTALHRLLQRYSHDLDTPIAAKEIA